MDHGPHSIYMARSFLGELEPVEVSCLTGNICADDYDTEDTVQLEMRYSNGQQASVFLSWASAYRNTRYLIVGTSGYIEINDNVIKFTKNGSITVKDTGAKFNDPSHSNWFNPMFLDFQERVESFGRPISQAPLLEAFFVSATIDAGYASARNKGWWMPIERIGDL